MSVSVLARLVVRRNKLCWRVDSSGPNKMLGPLCHYISSFQVKSPLFAQYHLNSSGVWFPQLLLYSAEEEEFPSISWYRICCFHLSLSSSGLLLCERKVCFSHLCSSVHLPGSFSLKTASQSSSPIPLKAPGMWWWVNAFPFQQTLCSWAVDYFSLAGWNWNLELTKEMDGFWTSEMTKHCWNWA